MKKVKFIALPLILMVIASCCYLSYLFAQEKTVTMEDKIISSTFKTLVKAYVATADLNKLKQKGIDKINKMEERKFKERYSEVYDALKDLPKNLKLEYKVTDHKSKSEAIEDIKSVDKTKIYKAIDAIPDTIIADNFRQYLAQKKEELQKTNLAEQINRLWNKIIEKVKK
jgi:hypothetical protein